jgi:inner membrane protein
MASVGHIVVGVAAARVYHDGSPRWSSMAFWSALSLLPDIDVIGFGFGVAYGDPWGHRGATHSLTLAVVLAAALGLAASRLRRRAGRIWLISSVVLVSHGLLDALTDGGLGCALLWPFNLTRYFAPWRPIPVAPIGLDFLSPHGGIVALTELVLFSPVLLFALRSRRVEAKPVAAGFFFALWLASVWLISSSDPARDAIVGFVLREDTAYTSGFSEGAFRTITPGQSDQEVGRLLGPPFAESWFYPPKDQPTQRAITTSAASVRGCRAVRLETGVVVAAVDVDECKKVGIQKSTSRIDVERELGSPRESCWRYSWSPRDAHHRMRMVCFLSGRVEIVLRGWN